MRNYVHELDCFAHISLRLASAKARPNSDATVTEHESTRAARRYIRGRAKQLRSVGIRVRTRAR